jgi:hypothetical protein
MAQDDSYYILNKITNMVSNIQVETGDKPKE